MQQKFGQYFATANVIFPHCQCDVSSTGRSGPNLRLWDALAQPTVGLRGQFWCLSPCFQGRSVRWQRRRRSPGHRIGCQDPIRYVDELDDDAQLGAAGHRCQIRLEPAVLGSGSLPKSLKLRYEASFSPLAPPRPATLGERHHVNGWPQGRGKKILAET